MKNIITTIFVAGAVAILLFNCKKNDNQAVNINSLSEKAIISEIKPVLEGYIHEQYAFLTDQKQATDWLRYQSNPDDKSLLNKITFYKSELSKIDFKYVDYTSTIDSITIINRHRDSLSVEITESFTLTTNDIDSETNTPIVSEGINKYQVDFKYRNQKWLINKFTPASEDPWYIELSPNNGEISEEIIDDRTSEQAKYSYNPKDAQFYAYQYWKTPNEKYCDFKEKGDCTNFLSQCLKAGGWKQITKWRALYGNRCCNNVAACKIQDCYSCSWAVAHEFYKYVIKSGRINSACYSDRELRIGDILQIDFQGDGLIDHSTIVTKKEGSGKKTKVYVTYRNSEKHEPKKNKLSSTISGIHYGWKAKSKAN